MSRSSIAGLALGLAAMWALQGCGNSAVTTTTTTTVKAEATTTTAATAGTTTTTTTKVKIYPGGLRECMDVDTYYKVAYAPDSGAMQASGQCPPSLNLGAFYTKPGEKDSDGKSDKPWQCFGTTDLHPDQWTNEFAKQHQFEGACLFGDHNNSITPSKIEDCGPNHPAKCAPQGPDEYWGACYSSSSVQWQCIPKANTDEIAQDAKGDCKSKVLQDSTGAYTKNFFDGVCQFGAQKTTTYKCDTVKTYSATDASTCGGGPAGNPNNGFEKACFSLTKGTVWACKDKDATVGLCDWTTTPESTMEKPVYYRAKCVFKGSEEYENATDAGDLAAVSSDLSSDVAFVAV